MTSEPVNSLVELLQLWLDRSGGWGGAGGRAGSGRQAQAENNSEARSCVTHRLEGVNRTVASHARHPEVQARGAEGASQRKGFERTPSAHLCTKYGTQGSTVTL